MRIAFVGKGGSGKTTLSAAFIRYAAKNNHVLAIDADVNVHLKHALGFTDTLDLGHLYDDVAEYVRGSRDDLNNTMIVATTPPSLKSRFITCADDDPFLKRYAVRDGNIRLLSIGTYREEDVGYTCYHGKLNTLELIYHHLLDSEDDIVVADATAGIDNLGTSLFFSYDVNIFVVEPTQKSIDVYLDYKKVSSAHHLNTKVIVNKAEHGDEAFVEKYIDQDQILGYIHRSNAIRRFEQGDTTALDEFVQDNQVVFESVIEYARAHKRDWSDYYRLLLETHRKNSVEWWNDYYRQPIDTQQDAEFSYEKVLP